MKKINKSQFIMSKPLTMAAKDVVAAATKAGLSITEHYVHAIRSAKKREASTPTKKGTAGHRARKPGKAPSRLSERVMAEAFGDHTHAETSSMMMQSVTVNIGLSTAMASHDFAVALSAFTNAWLAKHPQPAAGATFHVQFGGVTVHKAAAPETVPVEPKPLSTASNGIASAATNAHASEGSSPS